MKRVIVTGGTSGIGKAAAKLFLERGEKVAIIGRDKTKGEAVENELKHNYLKFFPTDIRNVEECEKVVKNAANFLGGADILINSAGIYLEKPVSDTDEKDFDDIMSVNVKGTFFMTRAVLPLFMQNNGGSVVNIASDAGIRGNYGCSIYSASKGAIVALTKSLSLELASLNIRVNAVAPGDVLTPMTEAQLKSGDNALDEMAALYPLKRIGTASEIAEAIVFLASDKSSFTTGAILSVDGGITA